MAPPTSTRSSARRRWISRHRCNRTGSRRCCGRGLSAEQALRERLRPLRLVLAPPRRHSVLAGCDADGAAVVGHGRGAFLRPRHHGPQTRRTDAGPRRGAGPGDAAVNRRRRHHHRCRRPGDGAEPDRRAPDRLAADRSARPAGRRGVSAGARRHPPADRQSAAALHCRRPGDRPAEHRRPAEPRRGRNITWKIRWRPFVCRTARWPAP